MKTIADYTGANATVQILFPAGLAAWWVQFIVGGTGTVRLGDSTVSSSQGLPLAAGGGFYVTPVGDYLCYQSGEFYAYIPSGATLSVGFKERAIP
jgi:hypothetical protein